MRSPVAELLAALARALRTVRRRWYLFGAQAVLLYGGARLTADVDATVEPGDVSTDALLAALAAEGFVPRVSDVGAFVHRTRVLPLVHTASTVPLDLVLAGPGLEEQFVDRARPRRIEGVRVPVAAPEDIVAMKILAGRGKDLDDVRAILAAQREALDVGLVRETLRTLETALDRSDLMPVLERLLATRDA